ncbi:YraN family protein [Bacteroides sp. OttesenSCG-928-M17]|nr:YraN family protein [Bacteroides sp. OttesenSCG-928-M17]
MAEHNELGKAGEEAAVKYLERNDYIIRHRNWRRGHLELDIVAAKDNELIVIEVKTRKSNALSTPQEAVTKQKIRHTLLAADTYIKIHQIDDPVRFDIISVIGEEGHFQINHIEEAFHPTMW